MPGRGRPFERGRERTGGRAPGQRNNATVEIKALLAANLPGERIIALLNKKLESKDEHIAMKALEVCMHYMFGKPVQPIVGEELAPPIKIDISAIPKHRVKAR
jgi:hypothetical protein